jgi:rhodanese-related sulfurtransferase
MDGFSRLGKPKERYMNSITPQLLHEKIAAGENPYLLDVRTPREYAQVHVPGAILEPLESLDVARVKRQASGSGKAPLCILCQSGTRAKQAIGRLEAGGVSHCVLVEGGTAAWIRAGLPVERQAVSGISLERQVRIAAGFLVFVGTVMGAFVHPVILALPAFVGAGLIFAGVSDKCGMALLLARMPWNRAATASGCAARFS